MKDIPQFHEDFFKKYDEKSDKGYLLEVYVQYLEKLHELNNDLPILPEEWKLKKSKSL